MENQNRNFGVLAMTLTAFLWSIAGLFIKLIDWNPLAIAGMRSLIALIVIFIFIKKPKINFSFPQIGAAVANSLTMLLFISANKTTTAANAILLQYFAPVLTIFVGTIFLKEVARKEHYIALLLVSIGLIVMFMDDLSGGKLMGNLLAIMSAITFSLYFVLMRMQKDGSPLESILLSHLLTTVICAISIVFLPFPQITIKSIMSIVVLGVIQIGIPSILFSFAIKRISAIQANLIAVIEPLFNPVWVFVVLREAPGLNTVLGGTIIVFAVTMVSVVNAYTKEKKMEIVEG